MKFRALLSALVIGLCGCAGKNESAVAGQSVSDSGKNVADEYTGLSKDNAFYYGEKDALVNFIETGTGVIFFGSPKRENSQKYIGYLNGVLKDNDLQAAVFDADSIRKDEDLSDQVNDLLRKESGQTLVLRNPEDGTDILSGPLVVFLDNGTVTAWDDETASVEDVSSYWTDEKKAALKTKLNNAAAEISEAQKSSRNTGCEKACTFGGD